MPSSPSRTRSITGDSFVAEVIESSHRQVVLVDFTAAWCGPSQLMAPALEEIAVERETRAVVAHVDVDAEPDLAAHFGVRSIPRMLVFRAGQPVDTLVGVQSKTEILRHLDAVA